MLGEFIINILVLVLGYAYPALECFKTIETSRTENIGLRFWCQYWVILAIMTSVEKFGDIFISWLPLYGEFKLAFIVYLWHPRTRGTVHMYETFLKPFMAQHETEIEKRLQLMMSKAVDLLLFYIKNFADKGQSMAFEILQYVVSRSSKSSSSQNAGRPGDNRRPPSPPPSAPVQPSAPPMQSTPPPQYRPAEPYHPAEPYRPAESYHPVEPYRPAEPYRPMEPHRPAEPYRPMEPHRPAEPYRPVESHRPSEPARTLPLYPTLDRREDDMDQQVNRVEEALRAAGVNLKRLRPHQQSTNHIKKN